MMLIVSGVGGLIVAYSIGYMDGDKEERRYFAYMALFVFSMLLLVQGGNLLLLLAGWGMVGLSSYLLIGFWHERPSAIAAAKKAFVMNAIGDATMALALFLLIQKAGSVEFFVLGGDYSSTVATLVALGLLGGAVAKSAQLPLQTWLPDAMEGPTPVSALIHAATMVTAGVYLIVRTHSIFESAPHVADLAAGLGAATLLVAGLIALVQVDIKRVIAYSTMSQIGYMFLGVGLGAYANGMFHLMTHAFFKALLFMAAGIVIHALADEQDIRKMGGLRQLMPRTYLAFLIGSLALVGIFPFAGFFSKDPILAAALDSGAYGYVLWAAGLAGTFLTGLYTFRLLFLVFWGEPSPFVREHFHAPKRDVVGLTLGVPVAVLAVLSVIGGWIQWEPYWHPIETWLQTVAEPTVTPENWQDWVSLGARAAARHRRDVCRVAPLRRARRNDPCRVSRSRSACSSTSSTSTSSTTRSSTVRPSGSRRACIAGSRTPSSTSPRTRSDRTREISAASSHEPRQVFYAPMPSRSPRASPSSPSSSWRSVQMTTVLIVLPLAAALIIWVLPLNDVSAGALGLLAALAEVGVWIQLVVRYDFGQGGLQFAQQWNWFSDLHVSYHVGVYGFSVWLIGLTVVAMAAAIAYGFWAGRERMRAYLGLMLFLTGAVVGVFTAQDLLLFYAFFEAMMIPLYVLVGVWGGPGRLAATLKFVLFTMAGSLLMLASIVVYGLSQNTFDLVEIGQSSSNWIFLGFVAAFAIKAPLFPLHGWLPDAYRESSPEVAGVLSGVVSKAAAYGFLRIAIAKFPEPTQHYRAAILALAAVGLIYGSLLAFRAPDIRGVIAYSSLAQMGLITMGVFSVNDLGLDGAVLLMVTHGLVSTTLFLLAGMVERRTLTGELARLGGMARGRPILATVLLTTGVIALAVPLSSAFAGEFLVLAGVFRHGWAWSVVGAVAIVLAAAYVLRLVSAILHRDIGAAVSDAALDLRPAELGVVVPLVACLLALSAWPAAITQHSFHDDHGQADVAQGFK